MLGCSTITNDVTFHKVGTIPLQLPIINFKTDKNPFRKLNCILSPLHPTLAKHS